MSNNRRNTIRYTVFGVLFGFFFPVFSISLDILLFHNMEVSIDTILYVHKVNKLHFVIDTAPFFLGIAFGLAGVKMDKIRWLNDNLLGRVDEKTQHLERAKNDLFISYQELQASNEETRMFASELRKRNEELEDFSYMVSHNLKAPIANIISLVDILFFDHDKKALLSLQRSSQDLRKIVDDLTEILDIKSIKVNQLQEIDLEKLIHNVEQSLESMISETGAQIFTNFYDAKSVFGLNHFAFSIFYNLIHNSLKYRKPDEDSKIEINSKNFDENFICVTIMDNGLGINLKNDKNKIFKIYKKFHTHDSSRGFGLHLVKTQIEALGGRIEVESKVNQGSIFYLFFPNKKKLD